jgi:hypothetical protein
MSGDLFDRLEAELARSTREGAHLGIARARRRRRLALLAKRGAAIVALAAAMAATLVGEFPASASGQAAGGRLGIAMAVSAHADPVSIRSL